ncbi:MAG: hypothetical protein K8I00_10995 [Candidatus Omnitrophica bacterium]|nr:hypothetical protein [Candidatus Omnitrophota bacterium]
MAERKDLIDIIRDEINLLETKLEELQVQAKLGEMEAREQLQPEIQRMEKELAKAQERLEELTEISQQAFEEARKGLEGAVSELKNGLTRALDVLRSKS